MELCAAHSPFPLFPLRPLRLCGKFSLSMANFDPSKHPGVKIHESAYVDDPCVIGKGTKIWHFSHVMPNCRIGENCNLGQNVVVSPEVTLGNNVKVQNNVSIYTGVVIEDNVFCGPSMVFTNILIPRSE